MRATAAVHVQSRHANTAQATKAVPARSEYVSVGMEQKSGYTNSPAHQSLGERGWSELPGARPVGLALVAMLALTALLGAPRASASTNDPATVEAAEQQEADAEDAEEAAAQVEEAEGAATDLLVVKLRARERLGYVYKIHFLKHMIACALAKKVELKELPSTSKRRQVFLPQKREKLKVFRTRLREVRASLREKLTSG